MTQLLQETESQIQFQIVENEQITHRLGCQLPELPFFIFFLTLKERGSWMLLESGGWGLNQPAPSRSTQNTVKNPKIVFDFLKVHNELNRKSQEILALFFMEI